MLYPWSLHPEQNGRCKGLEGSVPAEPEAVPTAEPKGESTVASLSDKLRSSAPRDPSRERKLAVHTPGNRRRVGSNSKIFGIFRISFTIFRR